MVAPAGYPQVPAQTGSRDAPDTGGTAVQTGSAANVRLASGQSTLSLQAVAAAALLALLAALGGSEFVLSANVSVTRWFQATVPPAVGEPLTISLLLGSTSLSLALLAALGAVLYSRGRKLAALSLGLILVGLAVELALKSWVSHPAVWAEFYRPAPWYPVPQVGSGLELPSPFPSGHSMRTAFLVLVVARVASGSLRPFYSRLVALAAWLAVLCAGGSVVYLGWHWPTDAVGGVALGYLLVVGVAHFDRRGRAA